MDKSVKAVIWFAVLAGIFFFACMAYALHNLKEIG